MWRLLYRYYFLLIYISVTINPTENASMYKIKVDKISFKEVLLILLKGVILLNL